MSDETIQEWEEYDARLLDDIPSAKGMPATQRSESELLQNSVETPGALESPFLLGSTGEIAAESEGTALQPALPGIPPQREVPEFETHMQAEALHGAESQESLVDDADGKAWRADSLEFDPYAAIRSAMSPEHANLAANEVTMILGRMPATLVLHQLLNSPETQQATVGSLLGKSARRSVRVNGSDISIPAYFRLVSRLCGEVAKQSEEGLDYQTAPTLASATSMLAVLGPKTSPGTVSTIREDQVRGGLELPCKNVDLQTGARWASSRGPWTGDASGYLPVAVVKDVGVAADLQNAIAPGTAPGAGLGKTGGWFFSIPPAPNPLPGYDSRRMMKGPDAPFGAVINLNPCCFGEVYWIGGFVGSTYMAFAAWIPYAQWVTTDLPIVVHFRPYYNDPLYGEASSLASQQGVPVVLASDTQGHQPFLDGAWYYLLGSMGFVQQMLATRRVAILVIPIPPLHVAKADRDSSTIFPKTFVQQLGSVVIDVVTTAIAKAVEVGAGRVSPSTDRFVFTANSQGGVYLINAARAMKSGLREIWMFDCANMQDSWSIQGVARRLYIAQPENRKKLFQRGAGSATSWELEGNDWSVVDISHISKVPSNSLHDLCGRICFSHAATLSSQLATLRADPQRLNATLSGAGMSCWDRLEFWKQRAP